ncbi:Tubulin/FtsZ GTPase [Halorubrum distributum JCM 9100]|uniref:Tubulin-like protein CetZ n=2 Tax=Halorubrum distributum TaxID=29283 RepID=M0ECI4_9EURY|nr:tubulin/FtsZ family protein [Halorubrum distributum]ELZ45496.1 Tubulin/FtsZ GTPase [Halorubrum distributum JCM 9100]ELZ53995.1 Tubulin/FtsZ GTPase [Halorubrum distributum JCM 10118]
MKVALLGVGGCGTRLVDQFVRAERRTGRPVTDGNVLAFHTESQPLSQTTALSTDQHVLLGDTHPAVLRRDSNSPATDSPNSSHDSQLQSETSTTTSQQGTSSNSRTRGYDINEYGVGGDPDVGAQVAKADRPEIRRALDKIDETEVAATMVVAGLGGGTGAGVGSVLLDELTDIYETAVYTLGVLPADTESDQRALTAARGLRTLVPQAESTFLVDNNTWCHETDAVADCYQSINSMTVDRLLSVFGAGEANTTFESELRIDPADISRTLAVGGVTTVGRATIEINSETHGLLARILRLLGRSSPSGSTPVDAAKIKTLISRAVQSKLTLPCDITSADRVLLILSGPPDTISRKGFETGRYLLEDETETVEVLAGDEPIQNTTELTATVVLANVTSVPQIDQLQRRAVVTQDSAATTPATTSSSPEQTETADSVRTQSGKSQPDGDSHSVEFDFDEVDTASETTESTE